MGLRRRGRLRLDHLGVRVHGPGTRAGVPDRTVLAASPAQAVARVIYRAIHGDVRFRLGGWVLHRSTSPDNPGSVLVAGDPGMPLREAVALADEWAGGEVPLTVVDDDPIVAEAQSVGFEVRTTAVVLVGRLAELVGQPLPDDVSSRSPESFQVSLPGLATGRATAKGAWAVIHQIDVTAPNHDNGAARAVVRGLVSIARDTHARHAALVLDTNADLTPYLADGFVEHHRLIELRRAISAG